VVFISYLKHTSLRIFSAQTESSNKLTKDFMSQHYFLQNMRFSENSVENVYKVFANLSANWRIPVGIDSTSILGSVHS
jgi:hypothetical protein